jgi:outer membrane protein TolC
MLLGWITCLFPPPAASQTVRLDIEEALLRALRTSEALQVAILDYEFDVSRYKLSLREYLPDVTLGFAQDDSVVFHGPDSHLKKLSLGVEQLLFAGGARSHQRRALSDNLLIREREIGQLKSQIRIEVMNRFVEILKLGLQIEILAESMAAAGQQVAIAAEERKLGEITQLDYIDMELAVQDLEIELAVLKQEQDHLMFELKELLGVAPERPLELAGEISPEFRGMLPELGGRTYIERALNNSLELQERAAELAVLNQRWRQARRSWLPRVSTELELSVIGENFPLSEPGFSVGVNLDFAAPPVPLSTGITTGSRRSGERSLGLQASAELGENLSHWQSAKIAGLGLQKAQTELERAQRRLEDSVRRQLKQRRFVLDTLLLEQKKIDLQSRRIAIEALMLEVGEITRLEYLQSAIALSRQKIDQLTRIVGLFQVEAVLLAQCGMDMIEQSHQAVLQNASEE